MATSARSILRSAFRRPWLFRGKGAVITTSRETSRAFGNAVNSGADNWLCLAAAPTFAVMALLTSLLGGDPDIVCSAMRGASPLRGMLPMYLLMSVFHSAPWLRLIWRRGSGARRS
ncbi:MAG: hypothetical protein ACREH9_04025 [Pseudomonadota bacterium]